MKIKFFALLALVIFIGAVSVSIGVEDKASEVIPPNPKGFIGSWHPAPECGQCHVSLLSDKQLLAKLGSCNCHREAYTSAGEIDMNKIRKNAHGIKVCIDCHMGTGIANFTQEIPCDEYHKIHLDTDCQDCHGKREEIAVPESEECDSCHNGNPHTVHGDKTGAMCVICHGPFGIEYKEEGYQLIGGVPKKKKEMTYPTISNILKALIKFIFKQKGGGT